MVAAPVQCDVDGMPKWSHYAKVPPTWQASKVGPVYTQVTHGDNIPKKGTSKQGGASSSPDGRSFSIIKMFSVFGHFSEVTAAETSDKIQDSIVSPH